MVATNAACKLLMRSETPCVTCGQVLGNDPNGMEAHRDINELKLDLQLGSHNLLYEIYSMSLQLNIR